MGYLRGVDAEGHELLRVEERELHHLRVVHLSRHAWPGISRVRSPTELEQS